MATKDNFENGYFWELYRDLESRFETFLEYVPYLEGNEQTYSFKLLNLILSIGGHVDSALKEMIRYKLLPTNKRISNIRLRLQRWENAWTKGIKRNPKDFVNMPELLEIFETEYNLSQKKVIYKILPKRQKRKPFNDVKNEPTRGWWGIYNGLKHDVAIALKEANLKNTWDALGCAFLLNVTHQPGLDRLWEYHLLKIDSTYQGVGKSARTQGINQSHLWNIGAEGTTMPLFIETNLLKYEYDQP